MHLFSCKNESIIVLVIHLLMIIFKLTIDQTVGGVISAASQLFYFMVTSLKWHDLHESAFQLLPHTLKSYEIF